MTASRSISTLAAAGLLALGVMQPERAAAQTRVPDPDFLSTGSYVVAVPTADMTHFEPNTSFLGVSWEGQWSIAPGLMGGALLGFQDFYDQTEGTTNFPSGAVTGLQRRGLATITTMAMARWYVAGRGGRGPFLGLGLGGDFMEQYYQMGVSAQYLRSSFHLAVAPEVGSTIRVMNDLDVVLGLRYHATSKAGDYMGGGSRKFRFLTLSVGLTER